MPFQISDMTMTGGGKMTVPEGHTMTIACTDCGHQEKIAGPKTAEISDCPKCGNPSIRINMGKS